MKTATTLALVGGIAYLGWRAKQAAEAAALAAAPLPPPNSGPVVNGIGFYQLDGLHGLSGFGSKLKKAVKKVADNKVVKTITKIDPVAATTQKIIQTAEKKSPLIKAVSKTPDKTPAAAGQETIYQDANGATITLVQYNAIVSAMQSGNPVPTTGGWALPSGVISAENPNKPQQSPPFVPGKKPWLYPRPTNTGVVPPSINQGASPVYTPQPNEELVINSSYSDDYSEGPSTAFTASSSGSPALPGGITTELTTPSAQEAAPTAPAESGAGKWLVGTALAAGAAYLAFS